MVERPWKRLGQTLSIGGDIFGTIIEKWNNEFWKDKTIKFLFRGNGWQRRDAWVANTVASVISHCAKVDEETRKRIIKKGTKSVFSYFYDATTEKICVRDSDTGKTAPLDNTQAFYIIMNEN